jgi:hypothetical protein
MDRCDAAHEWLSSYAENTNVTFGAPIIAAAIHFLCRIDTRPDLQLSNREIIQAKFEKEAHKDLVDRFREGLAPKFRSFVTSSVAQLEVLPYSVWLISAGTASGTSLARCVTSFDMLNADEKKSFMAHVATMRALGLTYVFHEHSDKALMNNDLAILTNLSSSCMRLQPEIDKLVHFQDLDFSLTRIEIPDIVSKV